MKERAGKGGVSRKTTYKTGVIASNNNADKRYSALNTGSGSTKYRITQLQGDQKTTLVGTGTSLAEARKMLQSAIEKYDASAKKKSKKK